MGVDGAQATSVARSLKKVTPPPTKALTVNCTGFYDPFPIHDELCLSYADKHSCKELMNVMAMPYSEDTFLPHIHGSYILSTSLALFPGSCRRRCRRYVWDRTLHCYTFSACGPGKLLCINCCFVALEASEKAASSVNKCDCFEDNLTSLLSKTVVVVVSPKGSMTFQVKGYLPGMNSFLWSRPKIQSKSNWSILS